MGKHEENYGKKPWETLDKPWETKAKQWETWERVWKAWEQTMGTMKNTFMENMRNIGNKMQPTNPNTVT